METVICVAYAAWIFHHFIRIRRIRLFLVYSPATLCRHAFACLRECFNYRCGSCRWNFIRAFISLLYISQFVHTQRVIFLFNRGRCELQLWHVRPNESCNIYVHVSSFTSHDNNSLRERDRAHEQLIHVRFALIYILWRDIARGRGVRA